MKADEKQLVSESNYKPGQLTNVWESENTYFLESHPSRLAKILAHYELYQEVAGVAGDVIECGVFKGVSLMRFASFRNYLENDYSRKIVGFDAFGKFPREGLSLESDTSFIDKFEEAGGNGISLEDLTNCFSAKGFENVELVKGDVFNTIPEYLKNRPEQRIALLHLDLDVYEPTRFCIESFANRMVKGGMIILDDYNKVEGATKAADEFCEKTGLKIEKTNLFSSPCFIRI